jgi:hypothetical protein
MRFRVACTMVERASGVTATIEMMTHYAILMECAQPAARPASDTSPRARAPE